MPIIRSACACCALALAAWPVHAETTGAGLAQDWVPVTEAVLDQSRGGFTLETGLQVMLGIDREVSINGTVVARTSLQLTDLSRLSAEQAQQTSDALSAVKLVQNGSDNIYAAAMSTQTLGGTVIQNSLNDQVIRTHTVIHSSVNSMALLQALNFQGTLGEAIARAAGPH